MEQEACQVGTACGVAGGQVDGARQGIGDLVGLRVAENNIGEGCDQGVLDFAVHLTEAEK